MAKLLNLKILLPDWVNYVAQDEDGTWFGFEHKPVTGNSMWLVAVKGSQVDTIRAMNADPDWQLTLTKIEEE